MMKMKAKRFIHTRGLPKTGQTEVYRTGDDGTYQAGWWIGKTVHDNKKRFFAKTLDGDDVVIDRATGLMWPADGTGRGCNNGNKANFVNSLVYAAALDFAGFTDWRLPNKNELFSIINNGARDPALYTEYFINFGIDRYWTSSVNFAFSDDVWVIILYDGDVGTAVAMMSMKLVCVRGGL